LVTVPIVQKWAGSKSKKVNPKLFRIEAKAKRDSPKLVDVTAKPIVEIKISI
jgi:hypothetical protein